MERPRFQFSIRTLLWLTLVLAAFLGGVSVGRKWERSNSESEWVLPPKPKGATW